jgi:hypothetical protein
VQIPGLRGGAPQLLAHRPAAALRAASAASRTRRRDGPRGRAVT